MVSQNTIYETFQELVHILNIIMTKIYTYILYNIFFINMRDKKKRDKSNYKISYRRLCRCLYEKIQIISLF